MILNFISESFSKVFKKLNHLWFHIHIVRHDCFQEVNTKRCILINRSYNENTNQYPCVDKTNDGEYVYTKNGKTKIERFNSIVDFIDTLEPCESKKLF